jgi:carbon-monoxide dehydrogenase medium subunit
MLRPFVIHEPKTVEEASAILFEYGPEAAVYAGGTELLVVMKEHLAHFPHLVNIKTIPGLTNISLDTAGDRLRIGALATHQSLAKSPLLKEHAPLFASLESIIANVRVRSAGTIGGNLCFAEPHSDPAAVLVAWDARFVLESTRGTRKIGAGEFFTGLLETARDADEILTEIELPVQRFACGYERFKTHERPTATVAVTDRRIVAGSVGPAPQRLIQAEAVLQSGGSLDDVANTAAEEVEISDEVFHSAEYQRQLIRVLTSRALGGAR